MDCRRRNQERFPRFQRYEGRLGKNCVFPGLAPDPPLEGCPRARHSRKLAQVRGRRPSAHLRSAPNTLSLRSQTVQASTGAFEIPFSVHTLGAARILRRAAALWKMSLPEGSSASTLARMHSVCERIVTRVLISDSPSPIAAEKRSDTRDPAVSFLRITIVVAIICTKLFVSPVKALQALRGRARFSEPLTKCSSILPLTSYS
jgi:hypothetical protein